VSDSIQPDPGRVIPDVRPSQKRLDSMAEAEHRHCLLCGTANPFSLRLRFRVKGDGSVVALFPCREILQSYPETLHGGVISALLDAAMTNVLFAIGVVAVTAELNVRFLAPVRLNHGAVVRGSLEQALHPLYGTRAHLEQDGQRVAHAWAKFLAKGCV